MIHSISSFGERLYLLRENLGKTLSQMSSELKMEKSSLSRYEHNINKPSVDFLFKLLKIYSVNINWLLGGKFKMFIDTSISENMDHVNVTIPNKWKSDSKLSILSDKLRKFNVQNQDYGNLYTLPIAGEIAAGQPVEIRHSKPLESIFVAGDLINNAPDNYFVFKVNGKSMQPNIGHEDIVFIKRNTDWQNMNKKIVAIRINGEITLKKLQLDPIKGLILLLAFNPDYETIIVNPQDMADVNLIGELKSIIRKY